MKPPLTALCIVLLFIFSMFTVLTHCGGYGGGYISKKTEEKYLRNIPKYRMISATHFHMPYPYNDTLSYIAKTAFASVDFFHEWYIADDVGLIRPNSRLSKLLDSLSNQYEETGNKYK